jgi:hypothetical protein
MEPLNIPEPQVNGYYVMLPTIAKSVGPFEDKEQAMNWIVANLGDRVMFAIEELWNGL